MYEKYIKSNSKQSFTISYKLVDYCNNIPLPSHFPSPSSVIFSVAGLNVGKIENFYKVQIPNGKSYKPCYSIDIGKFNEKNKIS